jgi:hypothetical protein
MRDSWSLDMADASYSKMKAVAGRFESLKGNKVSLATIERFIKQKMNEAKALDDLYKAQAINPAGEILSKASLSIPAKKFGPIDIRIFDLNDEILKIEGLGTAQNISKVQDAMRSLASDGKVNVLKPTVAATANRSAFAFQVRVNRGGRGLNATE